MSPNSGPAYSGDFGSDGLFHETICFNYDSLLIHILSSPMSPEFQAFSNKIQAGSDIKPPPSHKLWHPRARTGKH